jgi:hypothetical protein
MLVMKELEREYRDLNKFKKDSLRVDQKKISTREDRTGALRNIR